MYCPKCKQEIFGGSICHLCGKELLESEPASDLSPSRAALGIVTRKKYKVTKEFGQTLPGHVGRLLIEILLFCTAFILLSHAVVAVANWLSKAMALPGRPAKFIDIHGRWMKYFWLIGCAAIVFLTVKLRFRPGK
ncbi:hypothetical protein HQ563_18035 [bacterium]|nr:hypothetical protein [bacterium]